MICLFVLQYSSVAANWLIDGVCLTYFSLMMLCSVMLCYHFLTIEMYDIAIGREEANRPSLPRNRTRSLSYFYMIRQLPSHVLVTSCELMLTFIRITNWAMHDGKRFGSEIVAGTQLLGSQKSSNSNGERIFLLLPNFFFENVSFNRPYLNPVSTLTRERHLESKSDSDTLLVMCVCMCVCM